MIQHSNIDYHCHILPGIDDGAQNMEESVYLSRTLVRWGFKMAYCTPHVAARYHNTKSSINTAFEALKKELERQRIPLEIQISAECRLNPETWIPIKQNDLYIPFNVNHMLIEFPISKPDTMGNIKPINEINQLVDKGFIPVIAHPERYKWLDFDTINLFRKHGALLQCNYGSLCGRYDDDVLDRVKYLISNDMVSLWGTDLHNQSYIDCIDKIMGKA